MNILLNGQRIDTATTTLAALLAEQQIDASCVASAINGQFVPRGQYAQQSLHEGCELEVLSPMQGG